MSQPWRGVFPAVTTLFNDDDSLDVAGMREFYSWQIDSGVHGLVVCGSLGEASTLSREEKMDVLRVAIEASAGRVPVLFTIAERSTDDACRAAVAAKEAGADGAMVLPPLLYVSDERETVAFLRRIAQSSDLPLMIYNNPLAYAVDVTPEMFAELANEPTIVAIKESAGDTRRIINIRRATGDRFQLFCGVDNLALEALVLGGDGWLAGLVCAFPEETVAIYDLVAAGKVREAVDMYQWFMPLLDLDVSAKLVQNIKLAQQMVGHGSEKVREPRLELVGDERAHVIRTVEEALATRPQLA